MAVHSLERQHVWEWLALGNFLVGGAGGGLYIISTLIGLVDALLMFAAAGMVVAGLVCVGLEAGNPAKAFYVFRNFRHSWMSREAVFAVGFVLFTLLDIIVPNTLFKSMAWVCSAAYVVSQGFMLAAAKKIPSWNTPVTPPLFIVLSLSAGLGIIAVLNQLKSPSALVLLSLSTVILGVSYAAWPGATKHFKQSLMSENNWVYLLFSLAATAAVVVLSAVSALMAGIVLVLSSSIIKYTVIIRMSYKLPVLPPLEPLSRGFFTR